MDTSPPAQQSDFQDTPEPSPLVNTSKLLKRGRPRIDRAGETAGEVRSTERSSVGLCQTLLQRRKEQIRLAHMHFSRLFKFLDMEQRHVCRVVGSLSLILVSQCEKSLAIPIASSDR
jgi:hypothetical protein